MEKAKGRAGQPFVPARALRGHVDGTPTHFDVCCRPCVGHLDQLRSLRANGSVKSLAVCGAYLAGDRDRSGIDEIIPRTWVCV